MTTNDRGRLGRWHHDWPRPWSACDAPCMTRGALSRLLGCALLVAGLAASVRSAYAETPTAADVADVADVAVDAVDAISGGRLPAPAPAPPAPAPIEAAPAPPPAEEGPAGPDLGQGQRAPPRPP